MRAAQSGNEDKKQKPLPTHFFIGRSDIHICFARPGIRTALEPLIILLLARSRYLRNWRAAVHWAVLVVCPQVGKTTLRFSLGDCSMRKAGHRSLVLSVYTSRKLSIGMENGQLGESLVESLSASPPSKAFLHRPETEAQTRLARDLHRLRPNPSTTSIQKLRAELLV